MSKAPLATHYLTLEKLHKLFDPGRVFYRVAVDEVLNSGELHQIETLLKGAKDAKAHYGDLDSMIAKLEGAAKKARAG